MNQPIQEAYSAKNMNNGYSYENNHYNTASNSNTTSNDLIERQPSTNSTNGYNYNMNYYQSYNNSYQPACNYNYYNQYSSTYNYTQYPNYYNYYNNNSNYNSYNNKPATQQNQDVSNLVANKVNLPLTASISDYSNNFNQFNNKIASSNQDSNSNDTNCSTLDSSYQNYYQASTTSLSSSSGYETNESNEDYAQDTSNNTNYQQSNNQVSILNYDNSLSFRLDESTSEPSLQSVQVQSTPVQMPKQNRNQQNKLSKKNQLPDRALDIMNEYFDDHLNNPYPSLEEKEKLARLGGITVKQVNAWFCNRRNRSQNTKPKRIKRELEKNLQDILSELGSNDNNNSRNKQLIIEKFRSTLVNTM